MVYMLATVRIVLAKAIRDFGNIEFKNPNFKNKKLASLEVIKYLESLKKDDIRLFKGMNEN